MKPFKCYFLAISLGLMTTSASLACGWDGDDPSYYDLFHCTQELPNLSDQHTNESAQFWARYAGLPADDALLSAVRYLRMDDFEDSEEARGIPASPRQGERTQGWQGPEQTPDIPQDAYPSPTQCRRCNDASVDR